MSVLGTRVQRLEDRRLLTAGGTYTADLRIPALTGALHATFVRSTIPHGRLGEIETDEARRAAGVVAVVTAADLHGMNPAGTEPGAEPAPTVRPWLASDTVRFVGEPYAVVVTERPEQGEDAAELVWGDLDPLPAVVDPLDALDGDTLLFPAHGSNVAGAFAFEEPDPHLFDDCDVVVSRRIRNNRVAPCPMEVRAAAAAWDGDHLTLWCSSQSVHGNRPNLARVFGLPDAQVRVVAPDVGGGFGAKINVGAEEVVVCWLARELGRPVRWLESRSENMVGMVHGRGQVQTVTLGGTRDGDLRAYRLEVVQDAGAYPDIGASLPFMTRVMTQGVYDIDRVEFRSQSVLTNTTPVGAYRGAGRPEASAAIERAVDLFAREAGLDPIEVRRRNLIPESAFPFTTRTGATYDCGRYEVALDRALAAAGYDELRAEQRRRRDAGDPIALGIGVSVYVEVTAGPFPGEQEYARVEVHLDGSATVYTGSSSHGQGHDTSWAMIVADRLGIPMAAITVVHGDTASIAEGTGTFGSRSLQVGGMAVVSASDALAGRARAVAAEILGIAADDVVLDPDAGAFHAAGDPTTTVPWGRIVQEAVVAAGEQVSRGGEPTLAESATFSTEAPSFPFGAHVAVVEVDTETGGVELRRIITCDDAGRVLNPLVVEGQRHGGIAQGVAQALLEEVRFDEDGNPRTANLADYGMISAAEVPAFELVMMETPTPLNALGAKGIGESGTIGATPAVQSAVVDALAHLGVDHLDLPTTPERVWRAIEAARVGEGGR